jgi:hypothetical protein
VVSGWPPRGSGHQGRGRGRHAAAEATLRCRLTRNGPADTHAEAIRAARNHQWPPDVSPGKPYCGRVRRDGPSAGVLRAFGVDGPAHALPGGQGGSWTAGHFVFKLDVGTCQDQLGMALRDLEADGIRIAKPVPTAGGAWRYEGWSATQWVDGVGPDPASATVWLDVIEAGRAFHRAVAHLSRPPCLDERSDPWAAADRAAWAEKSVPVHDAFTVVAERLREALQPLGRSQLVHGDLTGNVLFAPDLPPAVIDLSPYWRPPVYAEGVVLADALCWHDASPSLLADAGVSVTAVARALLFRLFTTSGRIARGELSASGLVDEAHCYDRAASAIGL